jgi:hypothetical protein
MQIRTAHIVARTVIFVQILMVLATFRENLPGPGLNTTIEPMRRSHRCAAL